MNKMGKGHWGWVTVCLVILLSVLVVRPPGAQANHYPATGDDSNCSACHTLDGAEGDENTSYIGSNARTFPQIKANDGLLPTQAPQYLGCTFCHYLNTNTAMKPILGHFQGWQSFHPVGRNFSTDTDTNMEFVSGYGQTLGVTSVPPASPTPNQLDCVDCHDINLGKPVAATTGYPDHSNRPAGNPYMLRGITGPGEYDGLCRTCHRSDVPLTIKGVVGMRLTQHADGAVGRPIVEDDGTVLRTNDLDKNGIPDVVGIVDQCRVCHDSHYSEKRRLFSDGHERHKEGAVEVMDAEIFGDGANCTAICHYPGDNNNLDAQGKVGSFGKYGHGKAESAYKYQNFTPNAAGAPVTMSMNCANCHVSLDISTKPHVEPVPSGANDREKYKNRFNLNISLQIADIGSAYGNPIWGVCFQCHSGYDKHVGAGKNIGCQDCHDEHGEGSGTANLFMIPERSKVEGTYIPFGTTHTNTKVGTEAVTYSSPRFILTSNPYAPDVDNEDFYRPGALDAGDGVCDVQECHGAGRRLNTIMPAGQLHPTKSLSVEIPGADCEGCHQHNGDPVGGWRATASCGECHSFPGSNPLIADRLLGPVHDRHANPPPAGYGFPCTACHFGSTHNGSAHVNNTTWNPATIAPFVNIRFDPARNPTNQTDYPRYNGQPASLVSTVGINGAGVCAGLYCHGDNQTLQAAASNANWGGSNETPGWAPGAQGCGSCHAATPATPTLSQAHTDHVTTAGYACADCHGVAPGANAVSTHVNGSVTLSGLTYSGLLAVGDNNFGTCSTGSCHNAGTNISWNTNQATTDCSSCHANAADVNNFVGNDRTASMISSTEYGAAGTGGHGKASTQTKTCAISSCHSMTAGHDFSAGLTGSNPYRLVDQIAGGSAIPDFSCSYNNAACHLGTTNAPVTGLSYGSIVTHSKEKMLVPGSYAAIRTWPTWKPRCTECHDPHGDGLNLSMIQREIYDKGSTVTGGTGDEDWGVHATPDPVTMVFTDNNTGVDILGPYTSYADNGPFSSICQECHEGVNPVQIVAFKDNLTASVLPHTATSDCSACHKHSEAFRPSGCSSCHGDTANQFWPVGAGSVVTTYPNRAGKHALHVQRIGERLGYAGYPAYSSAQQQAICAYCHGASFGGSHYDADWSTAELTRQPADIPTHTAGTFFKQMWGAVPANDAKTVAGSYVVPTYAGNNWNPGTAVCNNVDCHNEKSTATPYEWYGTGTTTCVICHADLEAALNPVTQSNTTEMTHQSHTRANTNGFGLPNIPCASCHGGSPAWGIVPAVGTPPAAGHINGTFEVSGGSVTFTYTGFTYPGVKVGCGTNICHNNGQFGTPLSNTYSWGTAISGCNACHPVGTIVTQSHSAHVNTTTQMGPDGGYGTCGYCHPPGGSAPTHLNGSVSLAGYVPFAYGGDVVITGTTFGSCGINKCHNNGQNTTADQPYTWGIQIGGATNTCVECHGDTAALMNFQGHVGHLNTAGVYGKTVVCGDCHASVINPGTTHLNGSVTLVAGLTYTAGDLVVIALGGSFGTCGTNACHNNGTVTGAPIVNPAWNTTQPGCAFCHLATPTTGSHNTHLAATVYGPHPAGSIDCAECHQSQANNTSMGGYATHVNGTVTFLNRAVPATPYEVASGQIGAVGGDLVDGCNNCHGGLASATAVAGAKDNWALATRLACGSCHALGSLANSAANGLGINAPDILGDAATYGSDVTGHTRTGTPYPVSGRTAAGKGCATCHSNTTAHINGINGAAFADARVLATINTRAVTSIETACDACHQNTGGDAGTQVSRHGNNVGGGYVPIEAAMTPIDCATCHEVHGLVNGGGAVNGWMFRYALTTPFGVRNVQLTANAGTNSFDEDDGETTNAQQLDDACATCHINGASATTLVRHTTAPAGGGIHENNVDYSGNERGKNCSACHPHDFDSNAATANGFTPQKCDSCHSYPGLPGPSDHTLSLAHTMHVTALATGGYSYDCTVCHYGYLHNQTNYVKGVTLWTAVTNASINVSFDTARNPGSPTYGGQPAVGGSSMAPGAGGTGACAALYCHGNNAALQSDWAGSNETPSWQVTDPSRLGCGVCHADAPATGAHNLHVVNNGVTNRTDCNYCHTSVNLIDALSPIVAAHVNGVTDVLQGYGNESTAIPPNGYCTTNVCHASAAADGRWTDTALNCTACHHYKTGDAVGEHGKHTNGAALAMTCASCHTLFVDSETPGAALTHPSNDSVGDGPGILDKAQALETEVDISDAGYNGAVNTWVNGTDTCSNAWCHDPSNAGTLADWDLGSTIADCNFCHAAVPATGSHDEHFAAQAVYGLTAFAGNSCAACHLAIAGTNYDHIAENVINGNVKFNGTVITTQYTAASVLPAAGWGTCGANACHNIGDGVTAPAAYTWNTALAGCDFCHLNPPSAGNAGARHVAHMNNTRYVSGCGSCHGAANGPTHIDGAVTRGGTVSSYTAPTCMNLCHLVNAANGDWLDAIDLACTDCHHSLYLMPDSVSGLHKTTNAMAHGVQFRATAGDVAQSANCMSCHLSSAPSTTHLTGLPDAYVAEASTATSYNWVSPANIASYSQANGCQATCHTDYRSLNAGGLWRRKWIGVDNNVPGALNNPGDAVCGNCHGDFTNGWRWDPANTTTTNHTDPYAGNTGDGMGNHGGCQTCHGWGDAAYKAAWGGPAPGHGDGSITMNGPDATPGPAAGAEYNSTIRGCDNAGCHGPEYVFTNSSAWPLNYGAFGGGACESCHNIVTPGRKGLGAWAPNVMGNGTVAAGTGGNGGPAKPFDDGSWGFNVSGHGANGGASTRFDLNASAGINWMNPNGACDGCHALQGHHYDGILNSATTGSRQVNTYHLKTDGSYPFVNESATNDYTAQVTLDEACYSRCHSGIRPDMRHTGADEVPLGIGISRFKVGTGPQVTNVLASKWPIDSDISTRAFTGAPDYMPCVTCHNVHGANISEPLQTSPRMMRVPWLTDPNAYCDFCHIP